jgi:hypothetical protein
MSDHVKIALIAAGTFLVALCIWIYFSPYHSCVRDGGIPMVCAHGLPAQSN